MLRLAWFIHRADVFSRCIAIVKLRSLAPNCRPRNPEPPAERGEGRVEGTRYLLFDLCRYIHSNLKSRIDPEGVADLWHPCRMPKTKRLPGVFASRRPPATLCQPSRVGKNDIYRLLTRDPGTGDGVANQLGPRKTTQSSCRRKTREDLRPSVDSTLSIAA